MAIIQLSELPCLLLSHSVAPQNDYHQLVVGQQYPCPAVSIILSLCLNRGHIQLTTTCKMGLLKSLQLDNRHVVGLFICVYLSYDANERWNWNYSYQCHMFTIYHLLITGKGGKNRRRGKNENESEKRELVFKEDGQGECMDPLQPYLTCTFSKQVLTLLSIWPAP